MHVETLTWSEMTLTQHAAATILQKSSLRRWRDLIDHGEFDIYRREQVYPVHICDKSQRDPQRSRRNDLRTIARDRDHASVNREPRLCGKRASVFVASRDGGTGVRLSFHRPSRLFPGDRRFRYFARFHRNLLQAIDKPTAGGARR
jgi:hypothetical protein